MRGGGEKRLKLTASRCFLRVIKISKHNCEELIKIVCVGDVSFLGRDAVNEPTFAFECSNIITRDDKI